MRRHVDHRSDGTVADDETPILRLEPGEAGEVIVYCPALTVMKEASARVVSSLGLGALNDSDDAGSAEIRALQDRYAQLWRLYVFVPADRVERAAPRAAERFGHASEHA